MNSRREAGSPATGTAIRRAVAEDAELLTVLGTRLFTEAYGATHPEPELSRYLARSFQVAEIREALGRPEVVVVLLVHDAAGEPVGYARMRAADLPEGAELAGRRGWEIQRFYVDGRWHGQGVAQQLMAACQEAAAAHGAEIIWLQVWRSAPRPIAFYRKSGYRIVGTTTFAFGPRVDQDWLMARECV